MRKTFVFDKVSGRVVPKGEASHRRMAVMPDIKSFVTVDGVPIDSRSELREYQRRTGLEQCGDDAMFGRNDDGSPIRRIVQEMPDIRADAIEAFKRHSS